MFSRAGRQEGSTLVEFGLIAPVLFLILIGIVYGGITFYDYETLANAIAVGARTMAINGRSSQACSLGEQAALNAATSLNISLITVSFPGTTTTGTYSAGTLSCTLTEYNTATITATYPCSMYFPSLGINLCNGQSTPPTISAQATIRIE